VGDDASSLRSQVNRLLLGMTFEGLKRVGENDLSEEAAHALYYRLVFFSTLMMIRTLNTMDMQVAGFKLNDLMPVFSASKRLSAEASDWQRLEQSISSINHAIDALIVDYS
jgi:hypothetical protein